MIPRIAWLRAEIDSDVLTFQNKVEELRGLPTIPGAERATLAQAAVALPEGPEWHQALLHVMTLSIDSVRPAILTGGTYALLQRLLGFRRFFRHVYAIDLDGARLEDLRACALTALPLVCDDLRRFDKFLAEAGAA